MIKASQYGLQKLADAKLVLTDKEKLIIPALKVNLLSFHIVF